MPLICFDSLRRSLVLPQYRHSGERLPLSGERLSLNGELPPLDGEGLRLDDEQPSLLSEVLSLQREHALRTPVGAWRNNGLLWLCHAALPLICKHLLLHGEPLLLNP